MIVLVDDGLQPWIESVGHHFESGSYTRHYKIDIVTHTVVGAKSLGTCDEQRHAQPKRDEIWFFHFVSAPYEFFFTTKREFKFRFCNAGWSYFLKSFSTLLFPFSLKMKEKKEYFIKFSQWKMQTAKAKNREDYTKRKYYRNFRTNLYFLKYKFRIIKLRNTYMTKLIWQNEYDRLTTTTNINNWTWPKLKLKTFITTGVLITSLPDVCKLASRSKPIATAYFGG